VSAARLACAVAFNLLTNSVGSFVLAAALSSLAARALRVAAGRPRQLFLALPLVKLASDIARGVPAGSFFWLKVAGERQDLGTFQFGVGIAHWVFPVVTLGLGALKAGVTYPQSVAELLATALTRKVGPDAPAVVVVGLVSVGAGLLARRVVRAARSMRMAEICRRKGRLVERRMLRRRSVDVRVCDAYDGPPFVTGLRRCTVCFSRSAYEALSDAERDAVVRHEMGHVAHADLALFAGLGLLADLFWFVPGLRSTCRAVRAEAEVAADQWALRAGASSLVLASALLRVFEVCRTPASPALGLVRGRGVLAQRVQHLLRDGPEARRSWPSMAVRVALALTVAGGILSSTGLGNH
jgi:beta-lactamase regulating signal transducer with metallopeptidase domain